MVYGALSNELDVISSFPYKAQYCFGPINVSNTASYINDIDDNIYNHHSVHVFDDNCVLLAIWSYQIQPWMVADICGNILTILYTAGHIYGK